MADRIGVLVIHGMGSQKPGFSRELMMEVSHRLDDGAGRVVWEEVHWADVLEDREEMLWHCMGQASEPDGSRIELDWDFARRFVVHNFGDAIAYHRDWPATGTAYNQVHGIISQNVAALKASLADPEAPIVVAAHSLGCYMMSNYIWDRQHWRKAEPDPLEAIPTLAGLVTFGCNIPLFSLAFPTARPIYLPGEAVGEGPLRDAVRWLNLLDRDDVLGWPLRPLYEKNMDQLDERQRETVRRIEDHEIDAGLWPLSMTPISHSKYWTDNDLTRPFAGYLLQLMEERKE